jgi:hypothetical protein
MSLDQGLLETFARRDRAMRRRREQAFIDGIRTIKLELMLLRERDRVRELEHGEWAALEEVGT